MSNEEWLNSLRDRTHKLSNYLMVCMSDVEVLKQQNLDLKRRIEDLERLEVLMCEFKAQSHILKWILGVVTVVICGILVKVLQL